MQFPQHLEVFPWKPATFLCVSGADAAVFLQGQFSNDLRDVRPLKAVYGLWLNSKGRVIADSFVGVLGEKDFWIGSYFSRGSDVLQRLQDYLVADEVEATDLGNTWAAVSVMGDGSGAWLTSEERVGVIFRGRRCVGENWEWIFPKREWSSVKSVLHGAREISAVEVARRRIEAGIPSVPADIGITDLPAEGGLDAVAISYTKGCYLGQEVMARLKSMGQVRRRLRRVRGRGPVPLLPVKLLQEHKPVGELRSVAATDDGFVGLAMISLVNFRDGLPVVLEGAEARSVEILPEIV